MSALAPRPGPPVLNDERPSSRPDPSNVSQVLARVTMTAAWIVAPALPVVGLVSLLLRSTLDPEWSSPRLHVVLFLGVAVAPSSLRTSQARPPTVVATLVSSCCRWPS